MSPKWAPEWPTTNPGTPRSPPVILPSGLQLARRRSSLLEESQSDVLRVHLARSRVRSPPVKEETGQGYFDSRRPANPSATSSTPLQGSFVEQDLDQISENPFDETTPLLSAAPTPPNLKKPALSDINLCTLAYGIASVFVFTSAGSILGTSGSKHIVATTSIYFHPARPLGTIIESFLFTVLILVVCTAWGAASMLLSHWLVLHGLEALDYVLILVVFLGGGAGVVGFLKVRMNNPSFNTACSVGIIFLVNILLKEDDVQEGELSLAQFRSYLLMVALGTTISTVVSVVFRRKTVVSALERDIDELTALHARMFELLLSAFMGRSSNASAHEEYLAASTKELTILQRAKNQLPYARLELLSTKHLRERYTRLASLVESLQRQSLHLGGIIHCVGVKNQLLGAVIDSGEDPATNLSHASFRGSTFRGDTSMTSLDGGDPRPEARPDVKRRPSVLVNGAPSALSGLFLFDAFLYHLGTPMRTLVAATHSALVQNDRTSLETASKTYVDQRGKALAAVYNHRLFGPNGALCSNADESLLATCGMFSCLVHYFSEEADETLHLRQIYYADQTEPCDEHEAPPVYNEPEPFSKVTKALYPTTTASSRSLAGLGPSLWLVLRVLRRVDVQHGLRVAFGAIIIASPAFINALRPWFQKWHGEWAVITYMIIMARNFGAMSKNIPLRIVGTLTGAAVALIVSTAFAGQPLQLAVCGCIVAWFCFRRILGDTKPILGRFVLLTYNLVCLYGYSVSQHDNDPNDPEILDPIYDVAFHRVIAVGSGVLWAVFITVSIWPHSARRALRTNLSVQWMRMGMVWKADPIGSSGPAKRGSDGARLRGVAGETELQNCMLELETLLDQSPAEFRLRGKFDPEPYRHLVRSTQVILDALHSMNLLISEDPIANANEVALIESTKAERQELAEMIFLYFYTASASIRLGFPVPENLPRPNDAVARLVSKLQERRSSTLAAGATGSDTEDFVLLYSYLMATMTISEQLHNINDSLRHVFGALDAELFSYV